MKLFLIIFSILIWTTAEADSTSTDQTSTTLADNYSAVTEKKPIKSNIKDTNGNLFETRYCPEPQELVKNDLLWTTKDENWKSYSESFAEHINGFIGAQWIGVKMGKIICLYDSKDAFDFPVALESIRTMLVFEPKNDNWSSNIKSYRICHSTNIEDCSFTVQKPKPTRSVYDDLKYNPIIQKDE